MRAYITWEYTVNSNGKINIWLKLCRVYLTLCLHILLKQILILFQSRRRHALQYENNFTGVYKITIKSRRTKECVNTFKFNTKWIQHLTGKGFSLFTFWSRLVAAILKMSRDAYFSNIAKGDKRQTSRVTDQYKSLHIACGFMWKHY